MKTFFALSVLLVSFSNAQAASNVAVVIDGETYSCSKGGAGSACSCRLQNKDLYPMYEIVYGGDVIASSARHSWSILEALTACKEKVKSLPLCN